MKWIGQNIYDLAARFRNDVYLEGVSESSDTEILVIDSDGKISKTERRATFTHNQSTAASQWVITHNLERKPSVTVIDTGGNTIHGTVVHVSVNQLTVSFKSAGQAVGLAGYAYIN